MRATSHAHATESKANYYTLRAKPGDGCQCNPKNLPVPNPVIQRRATNRTPTSLRNPESLPNPGTRRNTPWAEVSRVRMSTNAVLIGMGTLDDKELFVIEGSEKWALNSTRRSAKKAARPQNPFSSSPKPCWKHPSLLRLEMSPDSGDKLNLRTSQSQDTPSLHDHRDDHNRRSCTCGTPSRSCITFAISHALWHGATICSTPRKKRNHLRGFLMICGTRLHDLWHDATTAPPGKRREHSARCMKTSETRKRMPLP